MGKSWYTIKNDGSTCELALNATVGNSSGNTYNNAAGTGTNSVYHYLTSMSGFTKAAFDTENGAGFVTAPDTNGNTSEGLKSSAYWVKSGTIFDSTARYTYTLNNRTYFSWGIINDYTSGNWPSTMTLNTNDTFKVPSSTVQHSANSNATLANTSSSITYNNAKYSTNGTFTYTSGSVTGLSKVSETWQVFNPVSGAGQSTSKVAFKLFWGSWANGKSGGPENRANAKIRVRICGGSRNSGWAEFTPYTASKYIYHLSHVSSDYPVYETNYTYQTSPGALMTGCTKQCANLKYWTYKNTRAFSFAGSASSSVSSDVRTYDNYSDASCKTFTKYKLESVTQNVYYRPHVVVKIG